MILQLLIITIIVSVIFLTGFPFEIDDIISKKWRFHHLPAKPFLCNTCASWWLMAGWLLFTHQLSLISVLIALLLAYAAPTISNVIVLIKACVDKIIEAGMNVID